MTEMSSAGLGLRRRLRQLGNFLAQVSLVPPPPAAAAAATAASRHGAAAAIGAPGELDRGPPLVLELVSRSPLILTARAFATASECVAMISTARLDGRAMMSSDPRDRKFELDPWPSTGAAVDALPDPPAHPTTHRGGGSGERGTARADAADSSGASNGCAAGGGAAERAALMESVFDRIDGLLGAARQPFEVPPKMHFKAAGHGAEVIGGGPGCTARMPLGVHVDTNSSGTYATAILYLTSLPPGGDGATVFPLATATTSGASAPAATRGLLGAPAADTSATAPAAVGAGVGAGSGGVEPAAPAGDTGAAAARSSARLAARSLLSDHVLHTARVTQADDPRSIRHANLLVGAASLGQGGLSVYPEAGKLVLFFTRGDDGEVDPTSFHGGASVGDVGSGGGSGGDGDETTTGKWILQICKEVPSGLRGKVAMASFVAQQRNVALQAAAAIHCATASTGDLRSVPCD